MADEKLLKVTNIKTKQVWMKTADEIAKIKASIIADRFSFEKEVDAPKLADKIPAKAKAKPDEQEQA